jgi:hypothetical protein
MNYERVVAAKASLKGFLLSCASIAKSHEEWRRGGDVRLICTIKSPLRRKKKFISLEI